ncbi:MAG: hypothetical protein OZSIB_0762 [Candidatus Ozemobacter sibiricus]|uniref:HEAT repeat domain-containing protein n=1 Tax=Candidatus Ozemobacter sibiricus TaxID=2268124 RepID=A0A367ZU16_9BACT|nr:MAG: hypothetical protein OZSIB_0762 [Candidatus Ozemobacter sibiricus]
MGTPGEAELIRDLDAPIRTCRLFAIEHLLQYGASQAALEALQRHQAREEDPECAMLLEHAMAAIRSRLAPSTPEAAAAPGATTPASPLLPSDLTPEAFLSRYQATSETARVHLLSQLSPTHLRNFAPYVPALFQAEPNRLLGAALLRTFKTVWPRDHLKPLVPHLRSAYWSMRHAVMDLLVHKAPDLLARDLPRLLGHADPRVRILAVRGLAAVDPAEAERHLIAMFHSPQAEVRFAALQNSIFFPYSVVKPLLLQGLAMETDPEAWQRIALVLENNPDPDLPYRLWELAETSSEEKRPWLIELQKRVCANLQRAHLLEEDYAVYQERLLTWAKQRLARRWVHAVVEQLLDHALPDLDPQLERRWSDPFVQAAVKEALGWSIPETARQWLAAKLPAHLGQQAGSTAATPASPGPASGVDETATPPPIPNEPPLPSPAVGQSSAPMVQAPESTPDELLRQMARWTTADVTEARSTLTAILRQASEPPSALLAMALKTAARLKLPEFVEIARQRVFGKDAPVAAACLEYLGAVDFDWLLPYLGQLVQHEDLRVKTAVVRQLKRVDPEQALSAMKALLSSRDSERQKAALACLIHFEFALVRALLLAYLEQSPAPELFERGLCFFQANPDVGNLFPLYRLERGLSGTAARKARQVREENIRFLTNAGLVKPGAVEIEEATLAQRWAEEQAHSAKRNNACTVERVANPTFWEAFTEYLHDLRFQLAEQGLATWSQRLWNEVRAWAAQHPTIVGTALIGIIAFWVALGWEIETAAPLSPKGGAILSTPIDVTGTVRQTHAQGVMFESQDGRQYVVSAPPGRDFSEVPVGAVVRLRLLPIRMDGSGRIQAQFIAAGAPSPD